LVAPKMPASRPRHGRPSQSFIAGSWYANLTSNQLHPLREFCRTNGDLTMTEPRPSSPRRRPARVKAEDVMELLRQEYGPVEWAPRHDPARELVATILSQHTSDINSGRAFDNLMEIYGSVDALSEAPVADIEAAIRLAGLARVKAPRIKAALEQVMEEVGSFDLSFLGEMPLADAKAWLKNLPGVGPKTAAIILSFSLGMPAMPVDTHIHRVAKRLGLIGPKVSADKAHDILEPMVIPEDIFAFHVYLIQHGRQVCRAPNPSCDKCVLSWGCRSRRHFQSRAGAKAKKKQKSKPTSRSAPN